MNILRAPNKTNIFSDNFPDKQDNVLDTIGDVTKHDTVRPVKYVLRRFQDNWVLQQVFLVRFIHK